MRLLGSGVNVARTADDLVRYHGKYMIVDREDLYVLGFNFTYLDMEHSRSFGLITHHEQLVQEAVKLFDADTKRQAYEAGSHRFIVSPVNARDELSSFVAGAKRELAIYDPKIGDPRMIRLLEEQAKAGVQIRIIGKLARNAKLEARPLNKMRLHVRSMVRDRNDVFLGSQSLRTAELETRREVGVILDDPKIAGRILKTFDEDWTAAEESRSNQPIHAVKAARKVAKAISKSLPPMESVLEDLVTNVANGGDRIELDSARLEEAVKVAVKQAVEQAVHAAVEEATEA
jgi:phosphatidylserine/phosphatidylglycerophosphate/cardiolipin synthase-like enzyme